MTKSKRRPGGTPASSRSPAGSAPFPGLKTWHCLAIIGALAAVFFRNLLLENTYLWEDFLYLGVPARSFAAAAMASGHMPLWNPYTFNGMPFFADLSNAALYLPFTILAMFTAGGTLNFYWLELVTVLHYVLAGITMFYLARSFGLRPFAALFTGIAYMLTGPMIAHAIHLSITANMAWLPVILLLFRKSLASPQWKWVFLTALILGHTIFIGFPQLTLYYGCFLFLYFLFDVLTTYRGRQLVSPHVLHIALRAAAIVVLAVLLAAIQLLPATELAGLSARAQITYEKAAEGSLAWPQLLTLFAPKIFGTAGANGYNYWGPGTYWYFWETCVYAGVLPFVLMILSALLIRKNKYAAFFWGTALLALAYSLGDGFILHKLLFDFVPGFSRFRVPGRAGVLFSFSAVILSGFALNALFDETVPQAVQKLRKLLIGVMLGGVVVWMAIISGAISGIVPPNANPAVPAAVHGNAHVAIVLLLLSGVLILGILYRRVNANYAGAGLVALFFIDMVLFAGAQNDGKVNPGEYFRRSERLVRFIKKEEETEIFRVNTRNGQGLIMDRNQGMIDRFFTMEGYSPLVLQRLYAPMPGDKLFDLLNIKYKTVTDERTRSLAFVPHPTYLPRAFFVYRTHVVHSEQELTTYLNSPDFDHRATAVLEQEPAEKLPVPADTPRWSAKITRYDINDIDLDVSTTSPGFLILSETSYPGWVAEVDGQETEIFRTDFTLRGIFVAQGTHTISFEFSPRSYSRGAMISGATLLVCLLGITFAAWQRRRTPAPSSAENSPKSSP